MFNIIKEQKVKLLLIKNYKLSLDIEEKMSEVDTSTEIGQLEYDDYKLSLKKVGFNFDMIKQNYSQFDNAGYYVDSWKLEKPSTSEGRVFTSKYIDPKIDGQHTIIHEESLCISKCITQQPLMKQIAEHSTDLLYNGIYQRVRTDLIAEARELFTEHEQNAMVLYSDDMLVVTLILYNKLIELNVGIVVIEEPGVIGNGNLIRLVARLTNTNILLK